MVLSVSHYHFSKSLSCPFLLLTLPQRCSYALYPKDSSLLSIYRLFKFRLRLHCLQIVNKRVRLHEYLKMCWTNTSPPTSNPLKVWHNIEQMTPLKSSWATPTLLPTEKKAQKPTLCQRQRLFWHISVLVGSCDCVLHPIISLIWGAAPWGLSFKTGACIYLAV